MKKGTTLLLVSIIFVFLLASVSAAKNETNRVLINEFVTDPQTDWNNSSGNPTSSDEWFELHNPESSSVIIDNWYLRLIDSTNETENLNGTIPAGGYLTILNPTGNQNDDGRIELYDNLNNLIDSVTYGDYDDGNISDNAPEGNSIGLYDECLARFPNAIDTGVDSNDFIKTFCTYNSLNNFSFTPINITDLPVQPSCALDTDNLTISAEIAGSIAQVKLLLNTDGDITEIVLQGTAEGIYSYTVNASETLAGTTVEWQFVVTDVKGNVTFGETSSSRIFFITSLQIFPSFPDGLNGWYVSEPQFELSNPDAAQKEYRWNGLYHIYSAPFGLEGTPNNGNITGGTHVLNYWSDVCSESEKQFTGKFDFKDPKIENLNPPSGSQTFNEQSIVVSAHIDEIYQGNSGVNLSSIVMEIDNEEVSITVESVGLDADVAFEGNLSDGEHEASIYVEDKSGRSSSTSWTFELITPIEFDMTINMPTETMYRDRRIQFNLSLTREAQEIFFINYDDLNPIFKRLCRNCNGFGDDKTMFKSLREGENSLTFQAVDSRGERIEKSVSLTIDSKDPQILDVLPRSGLASGIFEIEFEEDNPLSLMIFFRNQELGFQNFSINISSDCQKNGNYHCISEVDLSEYDGTEIEYYVSLSDLVGNLEESRTRTLDVDMSHPIINSFGFDVEGKYAAFSLEVEEPYLKEIVYIDHMDSDPKETILCSSLVDEICQKRVSLRDGNHNITIIVRDEAGNEAEAFAAFFTDSKLPKIKRTEPTRGFASGEFVSTFEEVNPSEMYLTYGNLSEKRFYEVNLSTCTSEKKNFICTASVNLLDFEGQDISYWFNITDLAENFGKSKPISLKVDAVPPQITEFNYTILVKDVEFRIGVRDTNFDEVIYQDREETNPRFRTLCSRLTDEICEVTKRFGLGNHVLDIVATDKAGNSATVIEGLNFSI